MQHTVVIVLVILAVIGAAIGGLLDISGRESFLGLSKQHYWTDAIFLVAIAILIQTWNCCNVKPKSL